jgi:hypothetical protein
MDLGIVNPTLRLENREEDCRRLQGVQKFNAS